ncbi:alpha/beta fold hydrolase [Streptomyces sp. NPDC048420]|uniref:alpha/beta fold hydrolase n=1 Tax=Streptomyces sp. NPDC048420 TaxID=3155755 RepID=UPI00342902FF
MPALAERHTVIRYDLRGFGESAPPTGPFRETDDLRRLLDHLGHGRVGSWARPGVAAWPWTSRSPTRSGCTPWRCSPHHGLGTTGPQT